MASITEELLSELQKASDIDSFFINHNSDFLSITTHQYLNELLAIKGKSLTDVARNSGIGEYIYKIFGGSRKPSRDILISVSLGMELTLDETQLLLRISKFAVLDPRDRRDSIIIYAISGKKTVFDTDDILAAKNFCTLI